MSNFLDRVLLVKNLRIDNSEFSTGAKIWISLVGSVLTDLCSSSAHIRPLSVFTANQSENRSHCVGQWEGRACCPGDTSGPLGEQAPPNGGQPRRRKIGSRGNRCPVFQGVEDGSVCGQAGPASPLAPRHQGGGQTGAWRACQLWRPHQQEEGWQDQGREEWGSTKSGWGGERGCERTEEDSWLEQNASGACHLCAEAPGRHRPLSRLLRLAAACQRQHLVARTLQVGFKTRERSKVVYLMIAGASGTTPQSTRARRRSDTEIFSSSWTRELSLSTLMQSRFSCNTQTFKDSRSYWFSRAWSTSSLRGWSRILQPRLQSSFTARPAWQELRWTKSLSSHLMPKIWENLKKRKKTK